MKKMMKYATALVVGLLIMTACSKDYLETGPSNAANDATLAEDVEAYALYINGINELMIYQQGAFGQGYCGMTNLLNNHGNICGNDWASCAFGGAASSLMTLNTNNNAAYSQYSWWFLYQIIGQANRILARIDDAEGDSASRAYYKAQALTYRAYCYQYLVQIFCKRWMDSNNGASNGVILRLTDSTENMPLSTLAECYAQIYQDCDEAISLFQQSGRTTSNFYDPSINLAYGVKARAALTREDWETAATCAAQARNGHPLMSAAEFTDGFCEANNEWIFGGYGSSEMNMWYYTFGCYYAYNGYYTARGGYNVLGNRELVDALSDDDVRKWLFTAPSLVGVDFDALTAAGQVGIYCRASGDAADAIWDYELGALSSVYSRMSQTGYAPAYDCFYQHLKFAVFDTPGVSNSCWMRSAEMYLIQAEALCKQASPDYATAQQLLYTVNSRLDSSYTQSTATGQALIDEIMFYRRAELWGEGFDWFDLKRTGASISRKSRADGGVFEATHAGTVGPNAAGTNDWVWVIPLIETQYNSEL